jgi:hypothetical protein
MCVQVSNLSGPRCIAEHVVLKHPAASSEQVASKEFFGLIRILCCNLVPVLLRFRCWASMVIWCRFDCLVMLGGGNFTLPSISTSFFLGSCKIQVSIKGLISFLYRLMAWPFVFLGFLMTKYQPFNMVFKFLKSKMYYKKMVKIRAI